MSYDYQNRKIYWFGDSELEKLTDLRSRNSKPQVYSEILASLSASGQNFEDPEFPHTVDSVGKVVEKLLDKADPKHEKRVQKWRKKGWDEKVHWIRVSEFIKKQKKGEYTAVFNDGDLGKSRARMDIEQGMTGDCWFVSAVSALTLDKDLVDFAVPSDNKTNDAGIYHFRFWYQGAWVDMVVDDYIPCYIIGSEYKSIGAKPALHKEKHIGEFWVSLLEKAYAKLNTSYEVLSGNWPIYSLQNLTGGFGQGFHLVGGGSQSSSSASGTSDDDSDGSSSQSSEKFCNIDQSELPEDFYGTIKRWVGKDMLICLCTTKTAKGIRGSHAYTVTGTAELPYDSEEVKLVRIRNPWGHGEWTGDWSDDSGQWNDISDHQKAAIRFKDKDDGEFYMTFDDMQRYFSQLTTCTYLKDADDLKDQKFETHFGKWSIADGTTGGQEDIHKNPKFPIVLGSKATSRHTKFVLIVGLTLKLKLKTHVENAYRVAVYKDTEPSSTPFNADFFKDRSELLSDGETKIPEVGTTERTLTREYVLSPGNYVIVPSTDEENIEYDFSLRVMSFESTKKVPVLP